MNRDEGLLGQYATDAVTGFSGVITAYAVYHLTGQVQVLIESEVLQDGKPVSIWLDQGRLK